MLFSLKQMKFIYYHSSLHGIKIDICIYRNRYFQDKSFIIDNLFKNLQ